MEDTRLGKYKATEYMWWLMPEIPAQAQCHGFQVSLDYTVNSRTAWTIE